MNIAAARSIIAGQIWRRRKSLWACHISRPHDISWTFGYADKEYLAGFINGLVYGVDASITAVVHTRIQAFQIIDRRIHHGI